MDKREAEALFDSFLRAYRPDLPEAEIAEWKEQIKGVHAARICLAPVVMPGIFPTEVLSDHLADMGALARMLPTALLTHS